MCQKMVLEKSCSSAIYMKKKLGFFFLLFFFLEDRTWSIYLHLRGKGNEDCCGISTFRLLLLTFIVLITSKYLSDVMIFKIKKKTNLDLIN